jgi:hypothetical protein
MKHQKTRMIITFVFVLSLLFSCTVYPAGAVQTTILKAVQLNRITLESTDYSVIDADKDYVCVGQNLPSAKKVKMSVISKNNYKVVKTYSFDYYANWNRHNDDAAPLENTRYSLLSYPSGKNLYKNYILDMVTGKKLQLLQTSSPIIRLEPSTGCDTIFYSYMNGTSHYFSYVQFSTGKKTDPIKSGDLRNPRLEQVWNENGKYSVFYRDGKLMLLDAANMKQNEVCKADNEKDMFLDWLPNDKGIVFMDDDEIKLYLLNENRIEDTGIAAPEFKNLSSSDIIKWNKAKTKFAVNTRGRISYFDLKNNKKEEQDISQHINEIVKQNPNTNKEMLELVWNPDDDKIGIIGFKNVYLDRLDAMLIWNGSEYSNINIGTAGQPLYYKNYVLFCSDIFLRDDSLMLPFSLKMYDLKTKKLYTIQNVRYTKITPDGKNIIAFTCKAKEDLYFSGVYLVDETKHKLGKAVPGPEALAYSFANEKELYISNDKQTYSVFNFRTLKKESLVKFNKTQSSSQDRIDIMSNDKSKYLFIWKDKLKAMYIYNFWDSLMKIQINKSIDFAKGYSIISTNVRNVLIFNEKGTRNLYIYRLSGK